VADPRLPVDTNRLTRECAKVIYEQPELDDDQVAAVVASRGPQFRYVHPNSAKYARWSISDEGVRCLDTILDVEQP